MPFNIEIGGGGELLSSSSCLATGIFFKSDGKDSSVNRYSPVKKMFCILLLEYKSRCLKDFCLFLRSLSCIPQALSKSAFVTPIYLQKGLFHFI